MPSKKDIDRRIKSVKNTKKITYAMKLVSASKLKKAQQAVVSSRTYAEALYGLLSLLQIEREGAEVSHPLMEERAPKTIRLIVIGGTKGLAGGYNANLNKKVEAFFADMKATRPNVQVECVLFGKKASEYFRRVGRSSLTTYEELPDEVLRWPIDEVCQQVEADFTEGKIDEVYLVYTKFRSAISVTPKIERILPLSSSLIQSQVGSHQREVKNIGKVLFEPSIDEVFSTIIPRIFRALVRQASLDSKASEHGSRMTAMDAATKNAGELIGKLTLASNKLRQAKITSELLDIIGGSEAIQ